MLSHSNSLLCFLNEFYGNHPGFMKCLNLSVVLQRLTNWIRLTRIICNIIHSDLRRCIVCIGLCEINQWLIIAL